MPMFGQKLFVLDVGVIGFETSRPAPPEFVKNNNFAGLEAVAQIRIAKPVLRELDDLAAEHLRY
ncbi:hypothetical protein D3C84_1229380 [compost metagenome]